MRREDMTDLMAFAVVAEERSFTRAASKLSITQSALSQIIRRLEERLGVRLLARITRSVSPTQAGAQMLDVLSPMLRDLDRCVSDLSQFRDRPAGILRITTVEHAARMILTPKLSAFVRDYPDITIEIIVDYGLSDIVADRFDAGVRLGEQVAKDMIAARISDDIPMAIVASPDYLAGHPSLESAQDLVHHRCINLRLPTSETLNAWRLYENGRDIRVRVDGPLIFNTIDLILEATRQGAGLSYLPLDLVASDIAQNRLVQVLGDHTPPLPAYHLYYPSRRQSSPAFKLMVECLRYRAR